jgi:hypothetical protein
MHRHTAIAAAPGEVTGWRLSALFKTCQSLFAGGTMLCERVRRVLVNKQHSTTIPFTNATATLI